MKRSLLPIVFAALSLSASESNISTADDATLSRLLTFNAAYAPWAKKLIGCEGTATAPGENVVMNCRVVRGEMDYREYQKAREAAKKLFDLIEPK
jgi:hypothetical protein